MTDKHDQSSDGRLGSGRRGGSVDRKGDSHVDDSARDSRLTPGSVAGLSEAKKADADLDGWFSEPVLHSESATEAVAEASANYDDDDGDAEAAICESKEDKSASSNILSDPIPGGPVRHQSSDSASSTASSSSAAAPEAAAEAAVAPEPAAAARPIPIPRGVQRPPQQPNLPHQNNINPAQQASLTSDDEGLPRSPTPGADEEPRLHHSRSASTRSLLSYGSSTDDVPDAVGAGAAGGAADPLDHSAAQHKMAVRRPARRPTSQHRHAVGSAGAGVSSSVGGSTATSGASTSAAALSLAGLSFIREETAVQTAKAALPIVEDELRPARWQQPASTTATQPSTTKESPKRIIGQATPFAALLAGGAGNRNSVGAVPLPQLRRRTTNPTSQDDASPSTEQAPRQPPIEFAAVQLRKTRTMAASEFASIGDSTPTIPPAKPSSIVAQKARPSSVFASSRQAGNATASPSASSENPIAAARAQLASRSVAMENNKPPLAPASVLATAAPNKSGVEKLSSASIAAEAPPPALKPAGKPPAAGSGAAPPIPLGPKPRLAPRPAVSAVPTSRSSDHIAAEKKLPAPQANAASSESSSSAKNAASASTSAGSAKGSAGDPPADFLRRRLKPVSRGSGDSASAASDATAIAGSSMSKSTPDLSAQLFGGLRPVPVKLESKSDSSQPVVGAAAPPARAPSMRQSRVLEMVRKMQEK